MLLPWWTRVTKSLYYFLGLSAIFWPPQNVPFPFSKTSQNGGNIWWHQSVCEIRWTRRTLTTYFQIAHRNCQIRWTYLSGVNFRLVIEQLFSKQVLCYDILIYNNTYIIMKSKSVQQVKTATETYTDTINISIMKKTNNTL